jgi:hypothetical protein
MASAACFSCQVSLLTRDTSDPSLATSFSLSASFSLQVAGCTADLSEARKYFQRCVRPSLRRFHLPLRPFALAV